MISWDSIRRRFRPGRAPATAQPGEYLSTLYTDEDAAGMGFEEGEAAVQPPAGNRLPGEQAVRQAAITSALAVRHYLTAKAGEIRQAHARAWQAFRDRKARACAALAAEIKQKAQLESLRKKLAAKGLDPPAPRWGVTLILAVLGLGDLTVTQTALLVLDIPDKLFVPFLPFSPLTVAAVPMVVGMLVAAHFLGEAIKAGRYEPGLRQVLIGASSMAGGLLLAVSIAAIRIAYLASVGVATLAWPFIGVQLGLFAVAVAASTWAAHPFQAAWTAAIRAVRRAERRGARARRSAHGLAADVNELAEKQRKLVDQSAATARAILSTGLRQTWIYRRSYLLAAAGRSHPAPADLFTEPPEEQLPQELQELLDPEQRRQDSVLHPLEWASLDDLNDDAWAYLQDQTDHENQLNKAEDRGRQAPADLSSAPAYTLDGTGPGAAPNSNGQAGTAAKRTRTPRAGA